MIATNRTALQAAREGVREFFLLEGAEQKLAAIEGSRRDTMRTYYEAANRRLNVAQDLRGPVQAPAALTLYRQGSLFLALAYLASRGHTGIDRASTNPEEAFQELDQAFKAEGLYAPASYNQCRAMLVSPDPLDLDRLSADEAALRVEELDATGRWLSSLIDARSPAELKWTRFLRVGVTGAATIALLVMLVLRLTAPKNFGVRQARYR